MGELIERIRALPLREAAEAIPAIARLLGRLARDPRVDRRRRLLAVAALGYAAAPVDLVPDRIPLVGKLDDVVIIGLAIRTLLDGAPDEVVAEHWDGPSEAPISLMSRCRFASQPFLPCSFASPRKPATR